MLLPGAFALMSNVAVRRIPMRKLPARVVTSKCIYGRPCCRAVMSSAHADIQLENGRGSDQESSSPEDLSSPGADQSSISSGGIGEVPRVLAKARVQRRRLTTTGGLKGLPVVSPADELLASAVRKAKRIRQDMEVKNSRNRARKWTAERMDSLGKEVSKPIRNVIDRYKYQMPILHPFEATVADLTVKARARRGDSSLQEVLDNVNNLRKRALDIGKTAAMEGKTLEKRVDILAVMDQGFADMEALFKEEGHAIAELVEVQRQLRGIPIVQLHIPTIVLVGAPNVGKSSIVRALSTGTPEVNNYPFTTRGMTLGHMFHPTSGQRYQMMDTPGVLSRPDEERNCMESLTLASMQHLPTAVLFVMDLSGESGEQSSVEKQMEVRTELRRRFPRRPWLDVISKADLPRYGLEKAVGALPEGYLDVSVIDGTGLEDLQGKVFHMLSIVESVLFPPPLIETDAPSAD